jgi:predicted nucleotidyltransferase component of viral defense system
MKTYRETYIRKAEIAQLILLHQLYMQKESRHLIFQGGTAIRWCYGGSRFSEDLDFVTPLAPSGIQKILHNVINGVEKLMVPHFGVGTVTLNEKNSRADALKCFADFRPAGSREKISIKLEFERLAEEKLPDVRNHVLSTLSPVAYLIASGEFRVPRPHMIVVAQTPMEILSDKIRALLERQYLKGRDLFDLWYLYAVLKTPVDLKIIERKFTLYRAAFVAKRSLNFFAKSSRLEKDMMREAIEQDLLRFLPPDVLDVHREGKYAAFLETVRVLFEELKTKGVRVP